MIARLIRLAGVMTLVALLVLGLSGQWTDPWLWAYLVVWFSLAIYAIASIGDDLARERFSPPEPGAEVMDESSLVNDEVNEEHQPRCDEEDCCDHPALTDPPELQDVEVRPEYRRRGTASALTARAEDEARTRRFDRLRLRVSVDNAPAQALYRRRGFVDAGVAPERVKGIIEIRTGPIEVDDTFLIWEKRLDEPAP